VLNTIYLYRSTVECIESALVRPSLLKTTTRVSTDLYL
jgi:hypothetical protein